MESIWRYGLLHFTLIFLFIYYFGILYGFLALAVFVVVADIVLDKLGYVRITFGDFLMCHEKEGCNHNIAGYNEIEKMSYEELLKIFKLKAIRNIRKLRQVRTSLFGIYMWKDIDEDIAIKQVIKCSKSIKNMDETLQFMSDIVNQEMPSDKPLWEYHLVEDYTKDSSMLIVRMSHSFTDAMGIVSMLSCLNDEGYKLKIDKELPKQGLIQKILLILAAIPLSISFMTATKNMPTDEKAAKIREFKGENQHKIKFYVSKSYSFEAVKKCYKRYDQTTFNDYACGLISTSLDKWYKANGIEGANSIKTMIPVNMKPLAKGFDDLNMDNGLICFKHALPIGSSMEETMEKSKIFLKKYLKPKYLLAHLQFGKLLQFIPSYFVRNHILEDFYKGMDLVFSNVPFSSEPLYYMNKKVLNVGAYSNLQYDIKMMIVAITYQNQLKFELTANTQLKMNPDKFLDILTSGLENDIEINAKTD